jgi:hypothetical protein
MTNLSNDAQYMLDSLVEHEVKVGAGQLVFVAAYPEPGHGEPAVANLWSEDADGVKRTGLVDDDAVFGTDCFRVLEEAGLITLESERTNKGHVGAAMFRAYVLTDGGRAAADYE